MASLFVGLRVRVHPSLRAPRFLRSRLSVDEVRFSTKQVGDDWQSTVCLFCLPAAPCHTPSVIISLDREPRPNMDDRPLFFIPLLPPSHTVIEKVQSNAICCPDSKKCRSLPTKGEHGIRLDSSPFTLCSLPTIFFLPFPLIWPVTCSSSTYI